MSSAIPRFGNHRRSRREGFLPIEQYIHNLHVETRGKGLIEITRPILRWVQGLGLNTGLVTVYIRHTSASLTIQENADPDVVSDLATFFERLVPEDNRLYRHTAEGPDDMPAHIRSVLTQTQLSVPMESGRLVLGTWQGIYLFEHRSHRHRRTVTLHAIGE